MLALAERDELDILEVPLARLTDGYLAALAELEVPDPAEMADFLWMASRLLLLKSIRLLPGPEPEPEEADLLGWEEEVRRRLEEYRAYKELARSLMERASSEPFAFPPPARAIEIVGQEQPIEVGLLVEAFQSILSRIPPRPVVVAGRTWTLEEKLAVLNSKLGQGPIDVLAVIMESQDRLEAVVTFVALLELLRQGRIRIRQRQRFGPIVAELRE